MQRWGKNRNTGPAVFGYLSFVKGALNDYNNLEADDFLANLYKYNQLSPKTALNAVGLALEHLQQASSRGQFGAQHYEVLDNLLWKLFSNLEAKHFAQDTINSQHVKMFFFNLNQLAQQGKLRYWNSSEIVSKSILGNICTLIDAIASRPQDALLNGEAYAEILFSLATLHEHGLMDLLNDEQTESLAENLSKVMLALTHAEATNKNISIALSYYTRISAREKRFATRSGLNSFSTLAYNLMQAENITQVEAAFVASSIRYFGAITNVDSKLDTYAKVHLQEIMQILTNRNANSASQNLEDKELKDICLFLSAIEPAIRHGWLVNMTAEQTHCIFQLSKYVAANSSDRQQLFDAYSAVSKLPLDKNTIDNNKGAFPITAYLRAALTAESQNASRYGESLWVLGVLIDSPILEKLTENDVHLALQVLNKINTMNNLGKAIGNSSLQCIGKLLNRFPETKITEHDVDAIKKIFFTVLAADIRENSLYTHAFPVVSGLVESGKITAISEAQREILKSYTIAMAKENDVHKLDVKLVFQLYASLAKNGLITELDSNEISALQKLNNKPSMQTIHGNYQDSLAEAQHILFVHCNYASSTSFNAYSAGRFSRERARSSTPPMPQTPPMEATPPTDSILKNSM